MCRRVPNSPPATSVPPLPPGDGIEEHATLHRQGRLDQAYRPSPAFEGGTGHEGVDPGDLWRAWRPQTPSSHVPQRDGSQRTRWRGGPCAPKVCNTVPAACPENILACPQQRWPLQYFTRGT